MGAGLQNTQPRAFTFRSLTQLADVVLSAQLLADHYTTTLRQYAALRILEGRVIAGVEFTAATALRIEHGLGRTPRGWFPIRFIAAASGALREASGTPPDEDQLTLTSDVNATVDLMVF